jgi:hypothetical protein
MHLLDVDVDVDVDISNLHVSMACKHLCHGVSTFLTFETILNEAPKARWTTERLHSSRPVPHLDLALALARIVDCSSCVGKAATIIFASQCVCARGLEAN